VTECTIVPGTLHLGTSGFAYDEWKGSFYPEDIRPRQMLPYYASRFDSVEINYTFRKVPSERTMASWRRAVPSGFAFSLKANSRITHTLRLRGAAGEVREFLRLAGLLYEHLGVVLFQCPPNLEFDEEVLSSFLDGLPAGQRYAMEFRHPSWEAARELLAARGVAWCTAESEDQPVTRESWEPFGYLRLRKERYADEEIARWAVGIRRALDQERDVFCYFKHEEGGIGSEYAARLRGLLV
jgi:uncharacterized protein YecE (DUF72 family)